MLFLVNGATLLIQHQYTVRQAFGKALVGNQNHRCPPGGKASRAPTRTNPSGSEYENTFCHKCGKKIIERYGLYAGEVRITDGKCSYCGTAIPGVWKA